MIGENTSAGSVRINPVGLYRVAAPPQIYGIVRVVGRGAMRLSTEACEREGRRTWSEALVVGEWRVVVPAPAVDVAATEGAKQSAADRTGVRRYPWCESASALAS